MTNCTDPGQVQGQSHYVNLAAGRFHYYTWATDQTTAGNAVLLHGNADSSASWCRVAPALATAGVAVFAPDLRGHGASVRPPCGSYSLRATADDVLAFITALHLDAPLLVGHCWGAAVALVLATGAYGNQAPPALAGLVLEEPLSTFSFRSNQTFFRKFQAALRMPREQVEAVLAVMHPNWHPADRESVLEGLRNADPQIADSVIHDGATSGPLLPLLARLTVPTLLLRSDPRCGGLLNDTHWTLINQLLPANSIARHLPDTPHDIHRDRFTTFMHLLKAFLRSANPALEHGSG